MISLQPLYPIDHLLVILYGWFKLREPVKRVRQSGINFQRNIHSLNKAYTLARRLELS